MYTPRLCVCFTFFIILLERGRTRSLSSGSKLTTLILHTRCPSKRPSAQILKVFNQHGTAEKTRNCLGKGTLGTNGLI